MSDTTKLLHQWAENGKIYRLVARGKWNRGYEDSYTIAERGEDELGDPNWTVIYRWNVEAGKPTCESLLVSAMKSMRTTARAEVVKVIAEYVQGDGTDAQRLALADGIRSGHAGDLRL